MHLRNKWNLYHKLNFSYPFFFLISGPLKQGIVFLHLVLKEIIKFWTINRYIQFWNWMSEMSFLVCFQFTASLLKKTCDVPKFLSLYAVSWYLFWLVYFKPVISLGMIYYPAMYNFTFVKNFSISALLFIWLSTYLRTVFVECW